jgi:hypothetical protein
MKALLACLFLFTALAPALAEEVTLFRELEVEECPPQGACRSIAKGSAAEPIALEPYHKGSAHGLHGESRIRLKAEGVPFRAEITVNRIKVGDYLYLVLRSGAGKARRGVTKSLLLPDLNSLQPQTLESWPVEIEGRRLVAHLKVSAASRALQD